MMDFLQHNLFLVFAFGFGIAASMLRTFGPLNSMEMLPPAKNGQRASYGLAMLFVILAIVCMALQVYSATRPA